MISIINCSILIGEMVELCAFYFDHLLRNGYFVNVFSHPSRAKPDTISCCVRNYSTPGNNQEEIVTIPLLIVSGMQEMNPTSQHETAVAINV